MFKTSATLLEISVSRLGILLVQILICTDFGAGCIESIDGKSNFYQNCEVYRPEFTCRLV